MAHTSGKRDAPILQPEEQGAVDRYGVDVLTRTEMLHKDVFPDQLRSKYSVHPNYRNMAVNRIDWQLVAGGEFYRVTYTYEGFIATLPEPDYELQGSLDEDPIELHPNFEAFAGTPSAPLNGAVFIDPDTEKPTASDELGVFREFRARIGPAANRKAGVEGFLTPGVTWTENSFSTSRPTDLGQLGTIDSPSGPQPSFSGSRDWLYWQATYRQRGGIFQITKTWRLSGRGGWDPDIY